MNGLQRLPRSEETAILELVRALGLEGGQMACYMTRQQGHGRKPPNPSSGSFFDGAGFSISYNLMLCEYCGNLEPSAVCPAKAAELKERMRQLNA